MDITSLLIHILIALAIAGIANLLLPRKIPGGVAGMILIGLAGEFLGNWAANFLRTEYDLTFPFLEWELGGVVIVPSIVGAVVVLYVVTAFIRWAHYGDR